MDESQRITITRENGKEILKKELLACWHITSWNNKDQEIIMEIIKHKIDICFISEVRKKGKGNTRYWNHIFFYSGMNKDVRAKAGVA